MIDTLCGTLLLLQLHLRMAQEPGGLRGVEIVNLVLWAESSLHCFPKPHCVPLGEAGPHSALFHSVTLCTHPGASWRYGLCL